MCYKYVINTARANRGWLADHLGTRMHETFGHDRAYVLDPQGQPIFIMRDGETASEPVLSGSETPILALAAELRAGLRGGRPDTQPREEMSRTAFILVDGRPALLGVQPIIPFEGRVSVPEGQEHIYASLRFLDSARDEQSASGTDIAVARFT